jgi:hypothetical protein
MSMLAGATLLASTFLGAGPARSAEAAAPSAHVPSPDTSTPRTAG